MNSIFKRSKYPLIKWTEPTLDANLIYCDGIFLILKNFFCQGHFLNLNLHCTYLLFTNVALSNEQG